MSERILVVMPNWFGETLFATPMLRALRSAQPQAFIAALGVPRAAEVLKGNPCLDAFIPFETSGFGLRMLRHLRRLRCDTALVLRRSLTRTAPLCAAGIPRRIGFANRKSGWLLTEGVKPPDGSLHKAQTYFALMGPLGSRADGAARPYEYHLTREERHEAAVIFGAHGVGRDQPVAILHPGANWFHKRWPAERFARGADQLADFRRCRIVLTGSPEDRPLAQAIEQALIAKPVNLVGRTTVRQLAACLELADVVVSNDTGVVHLACALGRRVVALYGPTLPAVTGPLGDPTRTVVIHHPGCCPSIPCVNPNHPGHPGMEAISVEEVCDAVKELLAREKGEGGRPN